MKLQHLTRRSMLVAAAGVVTGAAMDRAAAADASTMRIVVPFPSGGNGDILARLIGEHLSSRLGHPLIVDNKPGAGTVIGTEAVVRAKPDGSTLLLTSSSLLTLPLRKNSSLRFAVEKDLLPVTKVVSLPLVLVASKEAPFKTFSEMIAWAKANPDMLTVGISAGLGGASHLAWERLRLMAKITATVIPYVGGAPLVQALLGNQVPLMIDGVATSAALVKDGRLRMLATLAEQRPVSLRDVPTAAEQGLSGYAAENWMGYLAPAGTPPEKVAQLQTEINAILALPEVRARILELGMEPIGTTPEAFGQSIKTGMDTWARIAEQAKISYD